MAHAACPVITRIECPELSLFREGKVRSVFEVDDTLLLVASDRVSAFDHILNEGIPNKGRILTAISEFWFDFFDDTVDNHLLSTNFDEFPEPAHQYRSQLEGRTMWVKKTEPIMVECVARGYIIGSGWKEYQQSGTVCGHALPAGLQLADKLPEPIFTPATKATDGHDENISVDKMRDLIGSELTQKLQEKSLDIYTRAAKYADTKGIIIADTKFEFGIADGELILIDEVLTPDSSRFWPKASYRPGISPPSYDKQIVRDYLESLDWDKNPPVPALSDDIVAKAASEYAKIGQLLKS